MKFATSWLASNSFCIAGWSWFLTNYHTSMHRHRMKFAASWLAIISHKSLLFIDTGKLFLLRIHSYRFFVSFFSTSLFQCWWFCLLKAFNINKNLSQYYISNGRTCKVIELLAAYWALDSLRIFIFCFIDQLLFVALAADIVRACYHHRCVMAVIKGFETNCTFQ